MSFHQLWLGSIQIDEYPPQTGSLSILLKPFDYISNYPPPPKFFDGVLTQEEAMPPLFPNKIISSPPSKKYLSTSYFRAENWVKKSLRKYLMLWIGFTFQEMSSGLWVSFRRRVSSGTTDPSHSSLKPPKMCHSRMSFWHRVFPFFLSYSILGWTHSVWSWS